MKKQINPAPEEGIKFVDQLIKAAVQDILVEKTKTWKPNTLLRLIELRLKYSHTDKSEEEFWTMIAEIRRNANRQIEEAKQNERTRFPTKPVRETIHKSD